MRVEWKCITVVNGVQFVMMLGVSMMHKLCVDDRVVVKFSLMMWTVLEMNLQLNIVHIMDGEGTTVAIIKMLEYIVLHLVISSFHMQN